MPGMNERSADLRRYRRRFPVSGGGFTLLEVMISMTLLVLIVVITMGSMRISSNSVMAGEKAMEGQERLRTFLSLIDAQIQSQAPLTYRDAEDTRYYFKGDRKSLRFSSNHSLWGGQKGFVIVEYRVEADPSGIETLYVSERIPGIDGRQSIRLIDGKEISFEYYYKDLTAEQGSWQDSLSGGTVIPEKIRLRLKVGIKNLSLVFPVRVWGEMAPGTGGKLR
jgi:general secretion pathway protein J